MDMSWIGQVVQGITDTWSAHANYHQAGYNRDQAHQFHMDKMGWADFMARNAHQLEVADLRKAGINPIMTATGGRGASGMPVSSSPSSSIGDTRGVGRGINSAMKLAMEYKLLRASVRDVSASADVKGTQFDLNQANLSTARALAGRYRAETDGIQVQNKILRNVLKGSNIEGRIDDSKWGEIFRYLNRLNPTANSAGSIIRSIPRGGRKK